MLDSKAAFCPRCGTSLNKPQPDNVSKAQPQGKDIAGEQTLLVNPLRENKKTPGSSLQRPGQATRPSIPSNSPINQPMAQSHAATATAARTPSPIRSQNSNGSHTGNTGQKQTSDNSKQNLSLSSINMKVVIALVVIIVLLIVVILMLSIVGHHPPAPPKQGLMFYYLQFSPYIASR
jgi:cobalamin biosynthesis Mg chelatase CobN